MLPITQVRETLPSKTVKQKSAGMRVLQTRTYFDDKEMIWRGRRQDFANSPEDSLGRSLLEGLLMNPRHISQICDNNGRQYTNQDIALMSIRVAQHLEDMNLHQEDIIGICCSNTDYVAPLVFGALLCGLTLSTLDPSFDEDGIRHTFAITQPKIMFCDGKVYKVVRASLAEEVPIFTMKDHLEGVPRIEELIVPTGQEKFFNVRRLQRGLQQTAAILCSSGTTGLPKGVCISHGSLLDSRSFKFSPEDNILCFSTIYWISGLLSLLQGGLKSCTRVITDQAFSPELLLRMVEENKVNILITPPSQMAMAVQSPDVKSRDLSSLEIYFVGGSAVSFAVIQSFQKIIPNCQFYSGYGMTELSGGCCFGIPSKAGSNGQLIPNIQVKIIDEYGNRLGISEKGEICIKSVHRWRGYYRNKEATDAIYDQDGWLRSGDIGFFDKEGSLFILDRIKDILKYNNFHFFPTEIEEVILLMADVVEVCVCGIPDEVSSFLPAAAVVKLPNSNLTEEDIIKYVAEKMAHFKQLRGGVYFMDSLSKTASGKNIRAKVTEKVVALYERRN